MTTREYYQANRERAREYARRWRAEHPEKIREYRRRYQETHREQIAAQQLQYRETHRDYETERKLRYAETHPEQIAERRRRWNETHPEQARERYQQHVARLKAIMFRRYGEMCACCGSTERLTIDHVNSDGRAHRRQLGRSSYRKGGRGFYQWLVYQYLPPGYQTLCMRCNSSKARGTACRLDHTAG